MHLGAGGDGRVGAGGHCGAGGGARVSGTGKRVGVTISGGNLGIDSFCRIINERDSEA